MKQNLETRVGKYKDYRASFVKENSPILETEENDVSQYDKNAATTSTLPMDEVIKTIEKDNEEVAFLKKKKRQFILKVTLLAIGGAIIVGLLIFLGIKAFNS